MHQIRSKYIRFCLMAGILAGLATLPPSARSESDAISMDDGVTTIDLGHGGDKEFIGFGWSRRESGHGVGRFRWSKHLEADILVDLDHRENTEIIFTAAPMYLNWQRQKIGLYVNRKFITEWLCPDDGDFHEYTTLIPADVLIDGKDVLTFRAGYRKKHRSDERELSIAIDRIEFHSSP